jgi:hypothetical protein
VTQSPLLDEAAQYAELDRQHAERAQRAQAAKRKWSVERVGSYDECAIRLDAISNEEDGFVHEVQATRDGFDIIWWRWAK